MAEQTPSINVEVNETGDQVNKNAEETSKEEKTKPTDKPVVDEELDDLLDNALKDFEKPHSANKPSMVAGGTGVSQTAEARIPDNGTNPMSELFAEEFSGEMNQQFEDAMKNFMGSDPGLLQQIEKLAESAGSAGDSEDAQREFANTLSQTLSSLAQNSEGLGDEMSEEELMTAFTSMGMEEGQEGFMPMMQGMMKNLLSRDVLYPSLKEMSQKYPKWLKDNEETTEKSQVDKYQAQLKIIQDICVEFEKEKDSEGEEVKKLRFERIVDLMQKMQELGQPPKDIVGDMAPGLEFDENGMPRLPGTQDGQCSVM